MKRNEFFQKIGLVFAGFLVIPKIFEVKPKVSKSAKYTKELHNSSYDRVFPPTEYHHRKMMIIPENLWEHMKGESNQTKFNFGESDIQFGYKRGIIIDMDTGESHGPFTITPKYSKGWHGV